MAATETATYELCDIFDTKLLLVFLRKNKIEWHVGLAQRSRKNTAFHSFARLWKAIISFVVSVRPYVCNNWVTTARFLTKFYICVFFDNLARKPAFDTHLTSITGTLLETYIGTFMISRCIFLRMRNVSEKSYRYCKNTFCVKTFSKIHAVCEIMCKNMVAPDKPQMKI